MTSPRITVHRTLFFTFHLNGKSFMKDSFKTYSELNINT